MPAPARRAAPAAFGTVSVMTTHTVILTGLRAVYGTGTRQVTALDGVTTSFASGTFTAVMGPSGLGQVHAAALRGGAGPPDRGHASRSTAPASTTSARTS